MSMKVRRQIGATQRRRQMNKQHNKVNSRRQVQFIQELFQAKAVV